MKTFAVKAYTTADEGTRSVHYGKSGSGKTTLNAMAPGAVFIPVDDGGRKIHHPITNEPIQAVEGVRDFFDLRDAIRQTNLYERGQTLVIDTITKVEEWAEQYVFQSNKLKGGGVATSMRAFGWDGPSHMLDAMRLILGDTDELIRRGVNVVFLAQLGQITVANAEGADYLEDGPRLTHTKQISVRALFCEAADHVFRIGYSDAAVEKGDKDKVGKITGANERAIFTGGAPHFMAKSRPVNGINLPPVVSFSHQGDDSIWRFLSGDAVAS